MCQLRGRYEACSTAGRAVSWGWRSVSNATHPLAGLPSAACKACELSSPSLTCGNNALFLYKALTSSERKGREGKGMVWVEKRMMIMIDVSAREREREREGHLCTIVPLPCLSCASQTHSGSSVCFLVCPWRTDKGGDACRCVPTSTCDTHTQVGCIDCSIWFVASNSNLDVSKDPSTPQSRTNGVHGFVVCGVG